MSVQKYAKRLECCFRIMEPGLPKTANEHTLRIESGNRVGSARQSAREDIPFALSGFQASRDANVAVSRFP